MDIISNDHRHNQSFAAYRSDPPDKDEQVLSDVSIDTEVAPKTSRPQLPEDLPVAIRSKRAIDDSVAVPPSPVAPPVFSRSLQVVARSKKATDDEYSQAVHRGQQLARITSAIHLHQAIAKNKLLSDVLISELLRIGPVSSSDISSIDPGTINKIVEDVDKLATSLTSDSEIQRIEKRMKLYASMLKKTEAFMKDQKVTGKEEFISEARTLKSKSVDTWPIGTYSEACYTVLDQLTQMRKKPFKSPIVGGMFNTISTRLGRVSSSNISNWEASMKFDQLRKGREIFKPLSATRDSLEDFLKDANVFAFDSKTDTKPTQDVQSNMNKLKTVAAKANTSKAMIDNVCRLFLTRRHSSGNIDFLFTHGFLDGYSDIQEAFKDLQDGWVNTAVHGQAAQLAKGLNYLMNLYEKSKAVAEHLHMEEPALKLMSSRCESLTSLADLANDIDTLSPQLEKIVIDNTPGKLRPSNGAKFSSLLQDIQSLSDDLNAVDDVVHLANELSDGKSIKSLSEIANNASKDVKGAYNKIMNDPDMKTLYDKILKRKKSLEILKEGNVLEALPRVVANFNEVDKYISGLSVYIGHLQTLRDLTGTKFIKKVVGGIEKFRGVNPPGSIAKTVNLVEDIKQKVVELKEAVDEMKVDTAPESKALEAPDLSEVSKGIGSALQGINSMKKFAALPQDRHQKLKTGCEFVNKQIGGVPVDPEDLKNLQLLISLPSQLDTISNGISSMKSSTTVSLEDTITAQTAVFQSAASVQGLQYDFIKIANSVEELLIELPAGPESDSIKEIIPILKELESIGLDFSRHNAAFQNSKSKLDELDLFFADYVNKLATPAKPSMTGLSSTQSSQGAQELASTEGSSLGKWITEHPRESIVCVFGIFLVIGGFVALEITYRQNEKNQERKAKRSKERRAAN